ncbi:DUF3514 domain-containing protein [Ehrlichia ruminantium]|uniref:DUF3514 domain-containing protein n=1 Tax=Ehrlichia ruminantium TaxID=779 RepID=A0AAE6QAN0_EHRRU|nr:DUF3514 domain-containing protein [Ehrlichia ruminantium]QGR03081.1 DUF3514 domain-containing protein [Ehrlichia ruminantium]QGR04006.1 DUF3514 domain-containing protein [Ehrlichia ruminantium]
MRLLKFLLGIIGAGMVLTGDPNGNPENNESNDPGSNNNLSPGAQGAEGELQEHGAGSTGINALENNAGARPKVQSGKPGKGRKSGKGRRSDKNLKSDKEYVDVQSGIDHSRNPKSDIVYDIELVEDLKRFRRLHAEYYYKVLSSAFILEGNNICATPRLLQFISNVVGNDPERQGLCFYVIKVSMLFQLCLLHSRNEHARVIVFDSRTLANPQILIDVLNGVLPILYDKSDFGDRFSEIYAILFKMHYSSEFVTTSRQHMHYPQVLKDAIWMLCKILEYKVTTGFDPDIHFTNEMVIGCVALLGSMYINMAVMSGGPANTSFRRRIGSQEERNLSSDIGHKLHSVLISLLYLYKRMSSRSGYKCGQSYIPQQLARHCSEAFLHTVSDQYSSGGLSYDILVTDIVNGIMKLIDRSSIQLLESDVSLYEQKCFNRQACGTGTRTLTDEMSALTLGEEDNLAESDKKSAGSEAVGQVASAATVDSKDKGMIDYTKLGARPKVRSSRPTSSTSKKSDISGDVADDQYKSIVSDAKTSSMQRVVHSIEPSATHRLEFRKNHVNYLNGILKFAHFTLQKKLCVTMQCKELIFNVTNDPDQSKICGFILKVSILAQYAVTCFSKGRAMFSLFDKRCHDNTGNYINFFLRNIVEIVNSEKSVEESIRQMGMIFRKHSAAPQLMVKQICNPDFYRKSVSVLYKLCIYKADCSCGGELANILYFQLIFACGVSIGSMYYATENTDMYNMTSLARKCVLLVNFVLSMYEVDKHGNSNMKAISPDVYVPNTLLNLISPGVMDIILQQHPGGDVPFSVYVNHIVGELGVLVIQEGIHNLLDNINIYESGVAGIIPLPICCTYPWSGSGSSQDKHASGGGYSL